MHIQRYAQAQDIPDALFPSLIDVQIECWGQSPFNEYKMCDDCGALYSLEEVCGSIDLYR
ncbi:MAG: hypothetical protein H6767_09000 [Candidatus Peribacteria bacterium]|nr:MAG: hypothetical protein H6767_09000 [Candidatus Peribacteria bacterium]